MLASDNILKPADGHVVSMPSQDMILGLYYLTTVMDGAKGQGRVFSSYAEAQMALDLHEIDMQAEVLIRLPKDFVLPTGWEPCEITVVDPEPGSPDVVKEERFHDGSVLFATSMGRILFNETLPVDYPFVNEQAKKKKLAKIVDDISTRYSTAQVAASLDALKDLGFTRAPWSGVTFAFSDVVEPPERNELVAQSEEEVAKINEQYDLGFYTEEDRRQAGACHVAAAACDGRELERRDDKNKRAGHRQQQQGFALRLHRAAQPDHACRQERKAQRPPCRTVCRRKIPFHDVHGIGALRYKQNAAHDHGKRQKSLFTLGH